MGTNKGHYEPCWTPLPEPLIQTGYGTRRQMQLQIERYEKALGDIWRCRSASDEVLDIVEKAIDNA
jgi:hypothetical protein